MSTRRLIGAIALLAVTIAVAAGAMSASAAKQDFDFPFELPRVALVGTWDVTLTLPGPDGADDGKGVGDVRRPWRDRRERRRTRHAPRRLARSVGADRAQAVRRDARVLQVRRRRYVGTTKVNATVRVAPDGETFAAVSLSELRDPAGNVIRSGLPGTAVGSRMHVERIPNQP